MTLGSVPSNQHHYSQPNGSLPFATDEVIITRREEAPQFFKLLKSLIVIGREDNNDIILNGQAVSRTHARIEKVDNYWQVTDVGSTNGTFLGGERLAINQAHVWKAGHPLQIGAYTLQWQSDKNGIDGQTLILMPDEVDLSDVIEEVSIVADDEISIALNNEVVELVEGQPVTVQVGILSRSTLKKYFEVKVAGISAAWYTLSHATIAVAPNKHVMVSIEFRLPQNVGVMGGEHHYEVALHNVHKPDSITSAGGRIIVPKFNDFEIKITSESIYNMGSFRLVVQNKGNISDWYSIRVVNAHEALRFAENQWETALMPNSRDYVEGRVSAEKRPIIGKPIALPFELMAQSSTGAQHQVASQVEVTPIISNMMLIGGGIIVFLLLMILFALFI